MIRLFAFIFLIGALWAPAVFADVKTPQAREALFEEIVAKTMTREAWSPIKNTQYGVSYPEAFEAYRQDFIDAQTEEDLYYAIVKLSNSRHDRHLAVARVEGGLSFEAAQPGIVPVKILPDFSGAEPGFFIADLAEDLEGIENASRLAVGHKVVGINGLPIKEYLDRVSPYHRGSTINGFFWKLSQKITVRDDTLPKHFFGDTLELTLKPQRGRRYSVSLHYFDEADVRFQDLGTATYPGFEKVFDFVSFDFYRATGDREAVLFDWYGFRDDLVEAMDATMAYAQEEGLLDHDVIWDGTRSRGGGRGAYAIQRLQPKPFKTTFGNLRLSDAGKAFVQERLEIYRAREVMSDGTRETIDDGSWLADWLKGDVAKGIAAGQDYTNNVPFKSAHLPDYSDGILQPAEHHFTGQLVCWLSPHGGSHLDQFAAMVADNDLCPMLGMPAGGYSNTWEWEEVLTWPGTDEPVALYMWSIGHTIRPNGQILEGNPADVTEYMPLTAQNYLTYYGELLSRTYEIFDNERD